jgi:hypothetical protein
LLTKSNQCYSGEKFVENCSKLAKKNDTQHKKSVSKCGKYFPDKNGFLKKFGKNVGKWQQNIHLYFLRLKLGV